MSMLTAWLQLQIIQKDDNLYVKCLGRFKASSPRNGNYFWLGESEKILA